jgi:hypothetical protein
LILSPFIKADLTLSRQIGAISITYRAAFGGLTGESGAFEAKFNPFFESAGRDLAEGVFFWLAA